MKTEIVYSVCNINKLIILDSIIISGNKINNWAERYIDSKSKNIYRMLSDVIKILHKKHSNYLFYDTSNRHEVLFKKNQSFKIYDTWINIFKELNLNNKFYFISNNTGQSIIPQMGYDNHLGFHSMIGWSYPYKYDITLRKFKKKFICLNRRDVLHRRIIFDYLNENYKNDSYISFAPNEIDNPRRTILQDLKITEEGRATSGFTNEFQKHSFCNIVTESRTDSKLIHITEKTDKCFSAGQPFILVAGPNYLKKLHELGFKTFDKWWDESYDNLPNHFNRLEKVLNIVEDISKYSNSDLLQMYKEMKNILQHNSNLIKNYDGREELRQQILFKGRLL